MKLVRTVPTHKYGREFDWFLEFRAYQSFSTERGHYRRVVKAMEARYGELPWPAATGPNPKPKWAVYRDTVHRRMRIYINDPRDFTWAALL